MKLAKYLLGSLKTIIYGCISNFLSTYVCYNGYTKMHGSNNELRVY